MEENQERPGAFCFVTTPSPFVLDPTSPPAGNRILEQDGYVLLVYPPTRARPLEWSSYPPIQKSLAAQVHPQIAEFEVFFSNGSPMFTGVGDGPLGQVLYRDDQESYEQFGRYSADYFVIGVIGVPFEQTEDIAEEFARRLFRHLRCRTRQWFAGRRFLAGERFVRTEVEVITTGIGKGPLAVGTNRQLQQRLSGKVHSTSNEYYVLNGVVGLTDEMWLKCLSDTRHGRAPDADTELLLDVVLNQVEDETLTALILGCSGVETRRDDIAQRVGANFRNTDVLKHLSEVLEVACGRSLSKEEPVLFELLTDMWAARGSMAHGGPFFWKSDRSVKSLPKDFADRLERLLEWLRSI